jgi:serine/threonine protein kinase
MAYSPDAPVFADRYRFEPVGDDWDRGRSGYTHLVYDLKEKRLGVIKRAEIISNQAVDGLKNEVAALRSLQGLGVPKVYDTGEAVYGSKKYFYMIMEYIDGIRVERNLDSLSVTERAEILTQLFGLLAQAHQRGNVNGDVDLKHLFWRRDKKQLVVIDWGNAKLNVDPKSKTEFAFDLARSAEVIYSLVTRQGHPPATGSIALPNDSSLVPGLTPLPIEFRNLCKWAPRTPSDGTQSPCTASELFKVSKKWLVAIKSSKPYKARKRLWLAYASILLIGLAGLIGMTQYPPLRDWVFPPIVTITSTSGLPIVTSTSTSTATVAVIESPTLTEIASPAVTPSVETPTITATSTSFVIPSPLTYSSSALIFDKESPFFSNCWDNTNSPMKPQKGEGFFRRTDGDWGFKTDKVREEGEIPVWTDFSKCIEGNKVSAVALNAFVTRLEPERENPVYAPNTYEPGREFGFFLEDQNGQRREYTLWIDKNEKLRLRVREGDNIYDYDEEGLDINFTYGHLGTREWNEFSIQVFLEINNQGFDILYLQEGPRNAVGATGINPGLMTRVDGAVRPTFDDIQGVGLIGRSGQTEVLIWPLVFFSRP